MFSKDKQGTDTSDKITVLDFTIDDPSQQLIQQEQQQSILRENSFQQPPLRSLLSEFSSPSPSSATATQQVIDPSTKPLRDYQKRILQTTLQYNTIVLLPTGAGKTWIAADAIIQLGFPALFLVPTIPLVSQQADALKQRPGMKSIATYHSTKSIPSNFDVLVSTPQAFLTAQARSDTPQLSYTQFKTIVFDEVHHVIKDHPYRSIALSLKECDATPRVIGLTASLTYSVGKELMKKSVEKLCAELGIEKMEQASDEELRQGGYMGTGSCAVAEVRLPTCHDRKDVVAQKDRQPHKMHTSFFTRIRHKTATQFSQSLIKIIQLLEGAIKKKDVRFQSPLDNISLKSWGEYARQRKRYCEDLYPYLQHWYEALRILIISWEEQEDTTLLFLRMMKCHEDIPTLLSASTSTSTLSIAISIRNFFASQPPSSNRLDNLYTVLEEKIVSHAHAISGFRGIIFVQQRVITHVLQYAIQLHPILKTRLTPCILYSSSSATSSLSISKSTCQESLDNFSTGKCNLLITTNVAEEGIDIPASNCVIYFDPMNHTVSYVQGRGRARQADSSFVLLNQRSDRPASFLAQEEKQQREIAQSFVPLPDDEKTKATLSKAQASRDQSADKLLRNITMENAAKVLQEYRQKTKATLTDAFVDQSMDKKQCKLTYHSHSMKIVVEGFGQNKKVAKRMASFVMIKALRDKRQAAVACSNHGNTVTDTNAIIGTDTTISGGASVNFDVSLQTALKELNEYCQKTRAKLHESFQDNLNQKVCLLTYELPTTKVSARETGRSKKDAKRLAASSLLKKLHQD